MSTKVSQLTFRLVMIGAPGSGKGTISSRLCDRYRLKHVCSGDLLRNAIQKGNGMTDTFDWKKKSDSTLTWINQSHWFHLRRRWKACQILHWTGTTGADRVGHSIDIRRNQSNRSMVAGRISSQFGSGAHFARSRRTASGDLVECAGRRNCSTHQRSMDSRAKWSSVSHRVQTSESGRARRCDRRRAGATSRRSWRSRSTSIATIRSIDSTVDRLFWVSLPLSCSSFAYILRIFFGFCRQKQLLATFEGTESSVIYPQVSKYLEQRFPVETDLWPDRSSRFRMTRKWNASAAVK